MLVSNLPHSTYTELDIFNGNLRNIQIFVIFEEKFLEEWRLWCEKLQYLLLKH